MALLTTDDELRVLLRGVGSVAIVGVSANPARPSHEVAAYLQRATRWQLWFVNPTVDEVLGQPTFASLSDLPVVPDLVDVFRRTEHLPTVTAHAIEVGAGAVWFQLGLRHPAAARSALDAGLDVVQDHCLKVEHGRLIAAV